MSAWRHFIKGKKNGEKFQQLRKAFFGVAGN